MREDPTTNTQTTEIPAEEFLQMLGSLYLSNYRLNQVNQRLTEKLAEAQAEAASRQLQEVAKK